MVARYNADLANNFGNLASRVLNMATSYCDAVAPVERAEGPLVAATARAFDEVTKHLGGLDYSAAYFHLWELIRAANSYIEDQEPWKLHKAGKAHAVAGILGDCLETLRVVAVLASPAIPNACQELWERLGLDGSPEDQRLPDAAQWTGAPSGTALVKGDALFPRKDSET
jgi:methionyl-tRNA synthetase